MSIMSRDWSLLGHDWDLPDMFSRLWERDLGRSLLRVEEFIDGKTMVVRAELPDIDPEKDVEISVEQGLLHIKAERQMKSENKTKDSYRSEFRYGSFMRSLPLPAGASATDVKATYKDGVLEIRMPMAEPEVGDSVKVPIARG